MMEMRPVESVLEKKPKKDQTVWPQRKKDYERLLRLAFIPLALSFIFFLSPNKKLSVIPLFVVGACMVFDGIISFKLKITRYRWTYYVTNKAQVYQWATTWIIIGICLMVFALFVFSLGISY